VSRKKSHELSNYLAPDGHASVWVVVKHALRNEGREHTTHNLLPKEFGTAGYGNSYKNC
jgi:hypothetical protein